MMDRFDIIDISQPISRATACFPGDVPFSLEMTVDFAGSQVMNLTAFTMSPHVGTHADAPVHVRGEMTNTPEMAGVMALSPYIGACAVIDVSPCETAITWEHAAEQLTLLDPLPSRI